MAAAALALASVALALNAVIAAAAWLAIRRSTRSLGSPAVRVYGVLTPGTEARVTVRHVTQPRPSQPAQQEEPR